MSIDGVSFENESFDIFGVEQSVLWNYHEVEELDQKSLPAALHVLSAKHETPATWFLRKESIKPMMSGGGRVSGEVGYSEREGFKGEVKVEFDFELGKSDTRNNNSSNNDKEAAKPTDVDSRDRDSEKDKN